MRNRGPYYRNQKPRSFVPLTIGAGLVLIILLALILIRMQLNHERAQTAAATGSSSSALSESTAESTSVIVIDTSDDVLEELLARSKRLAAGYDYDGAIALLQESEAYAQNTDVLAAIAEYEHTKSTLVRQDISTITHVFFHTMIVDNAKAFDGDSKEAGYNQVMTTMKEFEAMLQNMYEKGFVLVRLHDMAYEVTAEDGSVKMVEGDIMLPPGKKAMVMSQDDVCYYEYMVGDGFASRLVIGEDGRVTTEMDMDDGSTQVGDYDLIPVLNRFIDEHPDFSYKGAKAIIALTGYNGIFGYRTDESYAATNPNFEEDKKTAAAIAEALRQDGWELASHSWGHRHLGRIDFDSFKTDSDKWERNVESLIGPTDIILFPFGTDLSDWRPYTNDNERYTYMHNLGFRYYCTVDSSVAWVQLGNNYLRQGRRNLDGYRMWRDITEPDNPKLTDLFDAKSIFDPDRPTPVGVIRS